MRLPGIIALEAIDSAGKTTQANLLADYLDEQTKGGWITCPECDGTGEVHSHNPHCVCTGWEGASPGKKFIEKKECLRLKFPNYESPTGKLILAKLKGDWWTHGVREQGEYLDAIKTREALVLQSLMLTNRFEVADEIERAVTVEGRSVVLDRYFASGIAYGMADGLDYEWLMKIHTRLPKAHYVFIDIPVEESFKRRPERVDAYEGNKERLRLARINYLHLFERMGVDTSYWGTDPDLHDPAGWQEYRTSPSGYAIVNGIGSIEQVQNRIRKALDL